MRANQTHGVDTRDRLINSAVGLLHSHGYRSVGVKALCESAGVQKGSFYHFFSSKEDLTLTAVERSWQLLRDEVIEPVLAGTEDAAQRIREIRQACLGPVGANHSDPHWPHPCIFGRLAASITETEPALRIRLAEIFAEWADLMGGGTQGWTALADIFGRLVLAFTVDSPEVLEA